MEVKVIEPTIKSIPKKLRVAAYVRVSVEKELSEHSFAAQLDHFIKLMDSRPDWTNAGVYSDYGITGTKTDRPGFQGLMAACEAGQIDLVLTKSISRFCRNTVDLLNTIRHLKEKGINVHFERENMDTMSDSGELLLTLLASFAQEESRSMSENCKWSIRKRFEQGRGNCFHLYGYRWDGKEFHIEDHEAEIVRKVFSLYLEGLGPHAIAARLKDDGVERSNGTPFTYSRIVKMLHQEKYCGDSLLQKTFRENHITKRKMENKGEYPMYYAEGTHPQIISHDEFDMVKSEMAKRRELDFRAGDSSRFSCFTGKIRCASCGHTFRRCNKGGRWKRHIWKCGTKIQYGTSTCPSGNLPEKMLVMSACDVLELETFDQEAFELHVREVLVQSPYTLIFRMDDGSAVVKRWTYDAKRKDYTEVNNGENSYDDTGDKGDILFTAPEECDHQKGCGVCQGINGQG